MDSNLEQQASYKKYTSLLILVLTASKVLNFILNIVVARFVPKTDFGYVFIHLQVIYSAILFPIKEFFRKAALKSATGQITPQLSDKQKNQIIQGAVNTLWIGIPVATLFTSIATFYELSSFSDHEMHSTAFTVIVYMVSALLEALVEPFSLIHLIHLDFAARVKSEGVAMLLSSLTRFAALVVFEIGIFSFALGQLVHVLSLLLCYLLMHSLRLHKHYPRPFKVKHQSIFLNPQNKEALKGLGVMSLLSYLMGEGEKILILFIVNLTLQEQGQYAFIFNLGSALERFIFTPIVSNLFVYLSKYKDELISFSIVGQLIELVTIIGIGAWIGVYCYGQVIINLLYGAQWAAQSAQLSLFMIYILFLGSYNILEALLQSLGDSKVLKWQNYNLIINIALFSLLLVLLRSQRVDGVLAASLSMIILRIVGLCYILIQSFPRDKLDIIRRKLQMSSRIPVLIAFGVAQIIIKITLRQEAELFTHLGLLAGSGCVGAFLFRKEVFSLLRNMKSKSD